MQASPTGPEAGRAEQPPPVSAPQEGRCGRPLDEEEKQWQDQGRVDDIFHQKRKPKPILLSASILLGLMALGSLIATAQREPLRMGEEIVASGLESLCYRIAATLLMALLCGWLFHRSIPPKSEADQLTG